MASPQRTVVLSDREVDVLIGVVRGETNKEIACRLRLSPHTVRDRVTALRNKVGAASRLVLALAVSRGFLLGNELILDK